MKTDRSVTYEVSLIKDFDYIATISFILEILVMHIDSIVIECFFFMAAWQ